MKKIILFILMMAISITLGGCFGKSPDPDVIEKEPEYVLIENSITDVVEKVELACVGVYCTLEQGASTGSGVVYKSANGYYYVVTNEHVVDKAKKINVTLGGVVYYKCELVGTDAANDLAVIRFKTDLYGGTITPIEWDDSIDLLKKGQTVISMGCPLGLEYYNSVSTGVISRVDSKANRVQHTTAINPGNSGGGLFNLSGRLVGINVEKMVSTSTSEGEVSVEGMGFAITVDLVKKVVGQIEAKNGNIDRPKLGISVAAINRYVSDSAQVALLPNNLDQGIYVAEREMNSAAFKAGIMVGDIIYKVENQVIVYKTDVSYAMSTKNYGDTMNITVIRMSNGKPETHEINVKFDAMIKKS